MFRQSVDSDWLARRGARDGQRPGVLGRVRASRRRAVWAVGRRVWSGCVRRGARRGRANASVLGRARPDAGARRVSTAQRDRVPRDCSYGVSEKERKRTARRSKRQSRPV
ncbi:hypothetical protein Ate02nite_33270 [Paractinoplanes tereljensis]|uniref:Uncharacterized protein n=1 Tax=Paractinoplanes tereljensis TaxID=571912 RepID=A0A919NMM3_9ACTN|nr:hypothetical protein Ate02nite_33270 [Actinoplanes tereljensis]